jgi:succinyl-CoA synthetase alpha subunit
MKAGLGVTTAMHVGAEPILGLCFAEILSLFEADEETKVVVLFGEIGTVAEEEAAEMVRVGQFKKPLVAYISGRSLPKGIRFSHASAIVEGGRGTAESKVEALQSVGAYIADKPQDIARILLQVLRR